jgi:hypothetical protein
MKLITFGIERFEAGSRSVRSEELIGAAGYLVYREGANVEAAAAVNQSSSA